MQKVLGEQGLPSPPPLSSLSFEIDLDDGCESVPEAESQGERSVGGPTKIARGPPIDRWFWVSFNPPSHFGGLTFRGSLPLPVVPSQGGF